MAINLDELLAAISKANTTFTITKTVQPAEGAGLYSSLWRTLGRPTAGAIPPAFTVGSDYVPDNTTVGGFFQPNPTAGEKFIVKLAAGCSTVGSLIVYDRLWACSGFTTNITSTQTVTTPGALPAGRDPNAGSDVEPWLEVYTAPGATTATWTLTGVDSTGTSGRTWTYAHPANAESGSQMMPMVPGTAIGGCRQVESFVCSVSSGTAGNVGITLMRRLQTIGVPIVGSQTSLDAFSTGMPRVFDGSCLALQVFCSGTNTGNWQAELVLADMVP